MICNRCANELPSDTPVCRTCGPVTLDPGFAPLQPLPPIPVAAPRRETPRTESVAPKPPPRPQPERQSKAQRRRAAMASRAGVAPLEMAPPDEGAIETPLAELPRPRPITLLARLSLVVGAAEVLVGWAMWTYRVAPQGEWPWGVNPGAVYVASGLLTTIAAVGLFLLQPFGWYAQLAILAARVMWGSWANVVGIAIVVYLLRPGVKLLFSGREAMSLRVEEKTRVRKDALSPLLVPVAVALRGLMAAFELLPILNRIDFTR